MLRFNVGRLRASRRPFCTQPRLNKKLWGSFGKTQAELEEVAAVVRAAKIVGAAIEDFVVSDESAFKDVCVVTQTLVTWGKAPKNFSCE